MIGPVATSLGNFSIVDPRDISGWDQLIQEFPSSRFFHTAAWVAVLAEAYRFRPRYGAVISGGDIELLLPLMEVPRSMAGRRAVALPFTDFAPPLSRKSMEKEAMLRHLRLAAESSGWDVLDLKDWDAAFGGRVDHTESVEHVISLDVGTEILRKNLKAYARRHIAKAVTSGIAVISTTERGAVDRFQRLNCLTRRGHGLPPQPPRFFDAVHRHVISCGKGILFEARYEGRTVSSAVFFLHGDEALYKYGASDRKFHHLRPNNLVLWEAMRFFSEKGYHRISLGKTECDNEGLMRYKESFGATRRSVRNYRYHVRSRCFASLPSGVFGFHNRVFRLMPLRLLRWIGAVTYRYVA